MWGEGIPKLLVQGQYHCGLQAFMAISRGSDALTVATLLASPELADQALATLAAVHALGVLHGGVRLANFVALPDRKGVWLLDFELSCSGNSEELVLERQSFVDLLNCLPKYSL